MPVVVEPLQFRTLGAPVAPAVVEEVVSEPVAMDGAEQAEAILREAHECGRLEALAAAREEMERKLVGEREAVARVVNQFQQEKQRYFSEVESEVVRLSLAIAERVLHRESEMDPMLLAGAARVALEQVADSSDAVLRVPAQEAQYWTRAMDSVAGTVQIETDDQLARGEAVLKTRSGTVQLGMKAQLQEIERGFFELMARKPTTTMVV